MKPVRFNYFQTTEGYGSFEFPHNLRSTPGAVERGDFWGWGSKRKDFAPLAAILMRQ